MNSMVFVMLIASSSGNITEGYTFNSLMECERAVRQLKVNAVCIERKPVNIEIEMRKMISLMKQMQIEMNKE